MSSSEALADRLSEIVSRATGTTVRVGDLVRQPGGASKNTWTFTARRPGGEERRLVLRADRTPRGGIAMTMEADLLAAAARAGVPVPAVVSAGQDLDGTGAGYLVTDFVDGETIPRRILSDETLKPALAHMARQCGHILASLHRIPPGEIRHLPAPSEPVGQLRQQLDQLGQPHPAFELALRWLDDTKRVPSAPVVVHGDFRNGNFIVGANGIRAVLDWELAHQGDPAEDLGWLCVRAWRFGSPLMVGGFGTVDELLGGYEEAGGGRLDESILAWWTLYGTLRWGIICIFQTLTHLSGAVRSVELAAIGRRVCEVESDLLELLPWGDRGAARPSATVSPPPTTGPAPPHDVPSAVELLDAVRGYLETDVMAATEGRVRFHARVAANVVAMVGRQIATTPAMAEAHAARLAHLGVASEAELGAAIRSGRFDDRFDEVTDLVRATVADKLAVANPGYAEVAEPPG
jgi:aminoglycoside phosphotransferase (APT) family kinase protein